MKVKETKKAAKIFASFEKYLYLCIVIKKEGDIKEVSL